MGEEARVRPIWWAVTGLAIVGTVLNVLKCPWCFVVWILTNALWGATNWRRGQYPQAVLFAVYLGLSVWGLAAWLR